MTRQILFDFFGTLVAYSPSRTEQGYRRSHALLPSLTYAEFLAALDLTFTAFDRRADADDREFAMAEVAAALLDRPVTDPLVAEFERTYIEEWSAGVTPLPGLAEFLTDLSRRYRLSIVSNTHSPTMVPAFLDRLGLAALFESVVLSVDVGYRKPHPAIYRAAPAGPAVFVGDSYAADYAGPTAAGIPAYLIDPAGTADVPDERRLTSVFDLPGRLLAVAGP